MGYVDEEGLPGKGLGSLTKKIVFYVKGGILVNSERHFWPCLCQKNVEFST